MATSCPPVALAAERTSPGACFAFLLTAALLLLFACAVARENRTVHMFARIIGVEPLDQSFGDARGILSAAEAMHHGFDPYLANPFDPWKRRFNYPRIVLLLVERLGWGLGQAVMLGFGFAFGFTVALGILFRGLGGGKAWICAALILSPSTLMAIERGNIDLAIFALLCIGLAQRSPIAKSFGVFCGTVLKLFPIFALSLALLEPSRDRRRPWILAALGIGAYLILSSSDLRLIRANAPGTWWCSWGDNTLINRLHLAPLYWLSRCAALSALGLGFWAGRRLSTERGASGGEVERAMAWAGASIFIGAYFLGTNHNYRLIFLLLLLPFLSRLADDARLRWRRAAVGALALLFVFFWEWSVYRWATQLGIRHAGAFEEFMPLCALAMSAGVIASIIGSVPNPVLAHPPAPVGP